jgi:Mg-chelatase subunit ChlD
VDATEARVTLPGTLGTVTLAAPGWLAALLVLPLILAGARRARAAATCRALALVAVVLTLAGASVERPRPESGNCVVAAIDVSASVGTAAVDSARTFLGRLRRSLGRDDLLGSLVFAAGVRLVAHPATGARTVAALVQPDAAPAADDTDLAAAVMRAAVLCPATKQAAVVLFSDGNETVGSALAELALAADRVPIHPVLPAAAALPAVAVRRLVAPPFGAARAVVPLEVVVENRAGTPMPAAMRLMANGRPFFFQPVDLPPGVSVVALPQRWKSSGQYRVEAGIDLAPGRAQPRGTAGSALAVGEPLRVLFVGTHEAPVVAEALAEREMDVEVVSPPEFAARAGRLDAYHVVVLADTPRDSLPTAALVALARRVAAGGALIATGGEHFFGDAGFVGTPLEEVLPVTFESQSPTPKQREPIALYLVIDRSNSMGYSTGQDVSYGDKMEYAKRAALAVLDQLAPGDLVGAIAFDSQPYPLGPLLPAGEGRARLAARIRALRYGGGTDFKDALDTARAALAASGGRVRHAILLTDGDTNRRTDDHFELMDALVRDEITVTAIRIGDDTVNLELLGAIAGRTGGEFHHVANVHALPQLMVRDTQRLIDSAAERQDALTRIGAAGEVVAGIAESELPRAARWALTRAKPGAELRLYAQAGARRDPLVATWQYQLGRVAAVPMDFQGGGAGWPAWRGFGKLWTQLVTWAAPAALPGEWRLDARRTRLGTEIHLEVVDDAPGPFTVRLQSVGDVRLGRVGRREWAALVPELRPGVYEATVVTGEREQRADLAVAATTGDGRELRSAAPNRALLARLAELTGGQVDPEPATVLAARGGVDRHEVALDAWLVPLALVLLLADVALRLRMV